MTEISPEAEALVNHLERMDLAHPRHDKAIIERAITEHLAAVGLSKRPFRWMSGLQAAYRYYYSDSFYETQGKRKRSAKDDPSNDNFDFDDNDILIPGWFNDEITSNILKMGQKLCPAWNNPDLILDFPTENAYFWEGIAGHSEGYTGLRGTEEAEEKAFPTYLCMRLGILAVNRLSTDPTQNSRRMFEVWRPMVDAFEAGLLCHWVTRDKVICVLRPFISRAHGRFHNATGPAIWWPAGERYFFWRGINVPDWMIEKPHKITVERIRGESNQEIRRCMTEIYGLSRYLRDAGATLVHEDDFGKLWEAQFGVETWRFVEVENGTPESDGTRRVYILDVTGAARTLGWPIETARAAVAATYGLRDEEYKPEMRT